MADGTLPSRIRVTRPTKDVKRETPPSPAVGPVRSVRYCGSRPSGPPPEPFGNDTIDFRIASVSMVKGRGAL